jgi:phage baseplate assembly protein W
MPDELKTDLSLKVDPKHGTFDLDVASGEMKRISGKANLVQALNLRLLVDTGEIACLGKPRFGTRIRDLIGEPLDRANLELIRRYVRQALLQDPRVAEVTRLIVRPREGEPGAVEVLAIVTAVNGEVADFEVTLSGM